MENFENINLKGGELLRGLMSETPVHGLGRERFSETERTEIKSLLSVAGSGMDFPHIDDLRPRTVLDMVDFLRGGFEGEDKVNFKKEIIAQIKDECGINDSQTDADYQYKEAA